MSIRAYYVRVKAYLDRGLNEVAWLKNLIGFLAYGSGLAYFLGVNIAVFIPAFALILFVGALSVGYMSLEVLRMQKYEVEYSNTLHGGIKTCRK